MALHWSGSWGVLSQILSTVPVYNRRSSVMPLRDKGKSFLSRESAGTIFFPEVHIWIVDETGRQFMETGVMYSSTTVRIM